MTFTDTALGTVVFDKDAADASGAGAFTDHQRCRRQHAGRCQRSITTIDAAINAVSGQRADLGAVQNRLQHTVNSLSVAAENASAAESRIRDTDMAKEMTAFTRSQILQQAGVSMLAQANSAPQSVLKLLG